MKTFIKYIASILIIVITSVKGFSNNTIKVFEQGSVIINMGVEPQTVSNAILPYGLVYELLNIHATPIHWAINTNKQWQDTDFETDGIAFKSGSFIVSAENVTDEVGNVLTTYQSMGVVLHTSVSSFSAPVYKTLSNVPRWTLDDQNGSIAEAWLQMANIPATAYNWKAPSVLGGCDDLYVMPHADPCWETHGNLLQWNLDHKGGIWAGCHAVSALENMVNPSNISEQTNFLMTKDPNIKEVNGCYIENAAVLWKNHNGGSVPQNYMQNTNLGAHPIAQFLGGTTLSSQNGSEQIYIPVQSWRKETFVLTYDHDQEDLPVNATKKAAQIAFGRGLGDENRGLVLYEAGHSIFKSDGEDNIAALRIFFNWSLMSMFDKAKVIPQVQVPGAMTGGDAYALEAGANEIAGEQYIWTATYTNGSAAGTFSPNNFSRNPVFTPFIVNDDQQVHLKVSVIDPCGRKSFSNSASVIAPGPRAPIAADDVVLVDLDRCDTSIVEVNLNVLFNDIDPEGDIMMASLLNGSAYGNVNLDNAGDFSYFSNNATPRIEVLEYQVCDPGMKCSIGRVIINVGGIDENGCTQQEQYGVSKVSTAKNIVNATLVQEESNIIGQEDNQFIRMDDANSEIIIELEDVVVAGQNIVVKWKSGKSESILQIEESSDGVIFSNETTMTTQENNVTVNTDFVTVSDTKFLRLSTIKNKPMVDALVYTEMGCVFVGPRVNRGVVTILEDVYTKVDAKNYVSHPNAEGLVFKNIIGQPSNGTASISKEGIIKYTPNKDYAGQDEVLFEVCDANGLCNTGEITIHVLEDGCAPGLYKATASSKMVAKIGANYDTYVNERDEERNYSSCNKMIVNGESGRTARTMMQFSLNQIPSNAQITNAFVQLAMVAGDNESFTYALHEVQGDIVGDVLCSKGGVPNWLENNTGQPWANAGGDFTAQAIDVINIGSNGTYAFDATSFVVNKLENRQSQMNVLVKLETENVKNTNKEFASSEDSDSSIRPYLVVEYTVDAVCENIPSRKPHAVSDFVTTNYSNNVTIYPMANDVSLDGGQITLVEVLNDPNIGVENVQIVNGTHFVYTPVQEQVGEIAILYAIQNNDGLKDTGVVFVQVDYPSPIANEDNVVVESNNANVISLKNNDNDPSSLFSGMPEIVSSPSFGVLTMIEKQIVYTPVTGYTGSDSFTYKICEDDNTLCRPVICDEAVVSVTVINAKPIAYNDEVYTNPCQSKVVDVAGNDIDKEKGSLTTEIVVFPKNGEAVILNNRVEYTPYPGVTNVVDSLVYQICDNGTPIACDSAVLYVHVQTKENIAPVAVEDQISGVVNKPVYMDILTNDYDLDGDQLKAYIESSFNQNIPGTAVVLPNGLLEFIPNEGFTGTTVINYTLTDVITVQEGCNAVNNKVDMGAVQITINKPDFNDVPVAVIDVVETEVNSQIDLMILGNDDFGANGLSTSGFEVITSAMHGNIIFNHAGTPGNAVDDYISYIPNSDFVGTDSLVYAICDLDGDCSEAIAYINVVPQNVQNQANSDFYYVAVNKSFSGDVSINDMANTNEGVVSWGLKNGNTAELTMNSNGVFTYNPQDNLVGEKKYVYEMCVGINCFEADLIIHVTESNSFFSNTIENIFQGVNTNAWTVSAVDVNNDGYDDLFVTDKSFTAPNRLMLNNGDGTYTEVTGQNIVSDLASSVTSTWADVDKDGDLDVVVANNTQKASFYYVNNGDGTFTKNMQPDFTRDVGYFHHVSFVDIDNDGVLELYFGNYWPTRYNQLWKMDDQGNWFLVKDHPLSQVVGSGTGLTWADYNNDGYQDLLVLNNISGKNKLYQNQGGVDFIPVDNVITNNGGNSVSSTWGDVDNDGDLDVFISNEGGANNELYINNGNNSFTQITAGEVVNDGGNSHGASFGDIDADGDLDLFVANDDGVNLLYINTGGGIFIKPKNEDVTQDFGMAMGTSFGDFNLDGTLDLAVSTHSSQTDKLFSGLVHDNNWLNIKLKGTLSNATGIGARITVISGGVTQIREINSQNGIGGQNSYNQYVGLGTSVAVEQVIVEWPSGVVQTITDVAPNQNMTIVEPESATVRATFYYDANNNCKRDENEVLMQNVRMYTGPSNYAISNTSGNVKFYMQPGSYNWYMDDAQFTTTCNPNQNFQVTRIGEEVDLGEIGVSQTCTYPNLGVEASTTVMRVGFDNVYELFVTNNSINSANAYTLTATFPADFIIHTASLTWSNITYNTSGVVVEWSGLSLAHFETSKIELFYKVPVSYEPEEEVDVVFEATSANGDCDVADNKITQKQMMYGSIDPNDILAFPKGITSRHLIPKDQSITYKIRFQNVGNYPAEFVIIKDTIPNELDMSSFSNMVTSHQVETSIDGNVVTFYFPNIQLPDSTSDEEGSHGFVQFTLKQSASISEGAYLPNRAAIIFDYNKPIITNTVFHHIIGEQDVVVNQLLHVFPNPSAKEISFIMPQVEGVYEVVIYNATGQLVKRVFNTNFGIGVEEFESGVYEIRVQSDTKTYVGKFVKL